MGGPDFEPDGGRRVSRRTFLGVAAGSAGALFLAACAPGQGPAAQSVAPSATRSGPTTLRIATARQLSAVDMRATGGGVEQQNVFLHIYDALTQLDGKLVAKPLLAESWESVDPVTWRFKLRQGVKFQNGEDFNADAVKFTIDQFANLTPPYQYLNNWGAGWPPTVQVESPFSVLIKTAKPQAVTPQLLTRIGMLPPRAALEKTFPDQPVGTGAYKVVSVQPGVKIVLEANPGYWQGAPKIDRIEWYGIVDPEARLAALQSGEMDLVWGVPYDRAKDLQASSKFQLFEQPSLGLNFFPFNGRVPKTNPVSDVRVRKALTYAIDQQGLRDALLSGKGELNTGPSTSLAIGATDAGGYPKRDVAAAKRMLAAVGADNITLDFIFSAGQFPKDQDLAEALIAQLGDAGVKVKFEQLDSAGLSSRRPTANWDLMNNGVPGPFTGEATYHYAQLKAQQGFTSPAVEALLAQSDAATTTSGRVDFIRQAMKQMWSEVPYLWSVGAVSEFGSVKALQGMEYIPINWLVLYRARLG